MGKTTTKTAKLLHGCGTDATSVQHTRYLYAPLLQQFRGNLTKNVANSPQTWIPIECSLLIRYEFSTLSTHTRYIYVAILLYCGMRGTDEIPIDTAFLANALAVDARTIPKSLEELENSKLLLERKREREDKDHTTQTDGSRENGVVVVGEFDKSFSGIKSENENGFSNKKNLSRFSLDDCLKYAKQSDGVKNVNALANNLFQTGNADSFIMANLYPEQANAEEAKQFGEPIGFTNEPCSICFGARLADTDGKGYRKCAHCKDERGKSTGFEPQGVINE